MKGLVFCLLCFLSGLVPGQEFRDQNHQLQLSAGPSVAGLMVIARPPFVTHAYQGVDLHFGFTDIITVLPLSTDAAGKWSLAYPASAKLSVIVQCFWLEKSLLRASHALHLRQNTYQGWANGYAYGRNTWPVGVWLQAPNNATAYGALGINTFVGLWQGPTEGQLTSLAAQKMPVFASQNTVGLNSPHRGWIKGWTHQDEPDNAQWNATTQKYDPPITPAEIQKRYGEMKKLDPTRPVFLGLGVGVAYEKWVGRGTRTGHLEDYPEYIKGADIVCYDIYPVAGPPKPEVSGRLEYVGIGVTRLVGWAKEKPVWNWIEAAGIKSGLRPTPAQIRSEVWISIIAGATGTMYFAHEFKPKFIEATPLVDPVLGNALKGINARLQTLAPVLNSASIRGPVKVTAANPIDIQVKQLGNKLYIFAVNLTPLPTNAKFNVTGVSDRKFAVLEENRTLSLTLGRFADAFTGYQVHLYEVGL